MTDIDQERLRDMLIKHEGIKLKPYRCPAGYITIAVGRNLETRGINKAEAMFMLSRDISEAENDAAHEWPFWDDLSPVRKAVLIDMMINMGFRGLCGFERMIKALSRKDYDEAAEEMLDSLWANQVQESRVTRLVTMMKTGEW